MVKPTGVKKRCKPPLPWQSLSAEDQIQASPAAVSTMRAPHRGDAFGMAGHGQPIMYRRPDLAALHGRFWEMNDLLYHGQKALEDEDLRGYAFRLGLDLQRFEHDRGGLDVRARVRRDVDSGLASGVHGTPTLFVDGVLHRGGYDAVSLMAALEA